MKCQSPAINLYVGTYWSQDKNDGNVEKMKSTLILSYGYIALHAPADKVLGRIDSQILRNISKHFSTKVTPSLSSLSHQGKSEGQCTKDLV